MVFLITDEELGFSNSGHEYSTNEVSERWQKWMFTDPVLWKHFLKKKPNFYCVTLLLEKAHTGAIFYWRSYSLAP